MLMSVSLFVFMTLSISMYISMPMSMIYVHAVCPCPGCMPMSRLHVWVQATWHVHAACPHPSCMSMSKLDIQISMLHVAHEHASWKCTLEHGHRDRHEQGPIAVSSRNLWSIVGYWEDCTVGADRIAHAVLLARRFFAVDFRYLEI
jgi:hypothetical protein